MKVFIVEDSSLVCERLLEIVGVVEGMEVVGAADNFDEAVRGILAARPDVSILDVRVADDRGSGIDALHLVKPQLPRLKAIVLSNYATPQHMKASVDAGARFFLGKTVEFERIREILREFQSDETRDAPPKTSER